MDSLISRLISTTSALARTHERSAAPSEIGCEASFTAEASFSLASGWSSATTASAIEVRFLTAASMASHAICKAAPVAPSSSRADSATFAFSRTGAAHSERLASHLVSSSSQPTSHACMADSWASRSSFMALDTATIAARDAVRFSFKSFCSILAFALAGPVSSLSALAATCSGSFPFDMPKASWILSQKRTGTPPRREPPAAVTPASGAGAARSARVDGTSATSSAACHARRIVETAASARPAARGRARRDRRVSIGIVRGGSGGGGRTRRPWRGREEEWGGRGKKRSRQPLAA
mmetsp:Transcript_59951/g.154324  ORF Transcript_59951/g.154324 Transcript_59951/m.154324 type:complete len:295 (-) Transcript_59951:22-906(-)